MTIVYSIGKGKEWKNWKWKGYNFRWSLITTLSLQSLENNYPQQKKKKKRIDMLRDADPFELFTTFPCIPLQSQQPAAFRKLSYGFEAGSLKEEWGLCWYSAAQSIGTWPGVGGSLYEVAVWSAKALPLCILLRTNRLKNLNSIYELFIASKMWLN